jgi:hypothetical protein
MIPKELSHSGMEIKVWSKDLVKLLYHLTILFLNYAKWATIVFFEYRCYCL